MRIEVEVFCDACGNSMGKDIVEGSLSDAKPTDYVTVKPCKTCMERAVGEAARNIQ